MTRAEENGAGFDEMVDAWVVEAVGAGITDFGPLVCALPGVYPTSVRDALRRLTQSGRLSRDTVSRLLRPASVERMRQCGATISSTFPAPHPLDFDWRYAAAAQDRLLHEHATLAEPLGPLLLLGAPTLVPSALQQYPAATVVALDVNRSLVLALRRACPRAHVIHCDIMRGPLPRLPKVAAVIVDPPWYPEHLHAFLWVAARSCRRGGHVLVSLPPLGTRPGIAAERARFVEYADECGLQLVRLDAGSLPYVSPPFERNALRADGTPHVPSDWRRGDLAVFTRARTTLTARPAAPACEETWHEVGVAGLRVRLRPREGNGFVAPTLIRLVPGDILPTVSRRDLRRQRADVWTAGNRIFGCRGTGILLLILRALSGGEVPLQRVAGFLGRDLSSEEARIVGTASEQALGLINLEQDEQSTWEEHCQEEGISALAV
jgi:hypothetical protein